MRKKEKKVTLSHCCFFVIMSILFLFSASQAETSKDIKQTLRVIEITDAANGVSMSTQVGTYRPMGKVVFADEVTGEPLVFETISVDMGNDSDIQPVDQVCYIERTMATADAQGQYVFFLIPKEQSDSFVVGLDSEVSFAYTLDDDVITIHVDGTKQAFRLEDAKLAVFCNLAQGMIVTAEY